MKKALSFLAIGLLAPAILNGQNTQTVIQGTVKDSAQTIPYASVYLKNRPEKGMQSSPDGMFFLRTEKSFLPDTLVISAVGYQTFFKPIPTSLDTVNIDAWLSQDMVLLKSVEVKGKKNVWRKAMRKAWWDMHDAQIQETVRNHRFIFRITDYQPLRANYTYFMVPGINYVKIEGDSLTFAWCWAGGMVMNEKGELGSIEEYNPRINTSQLINKSRIRSIDFQEDNGMMMIVINGIRISIPKNIKTDAAIMRLPNIENGYYKGWIEPLPYPTPAKEDIQTVYQRTPGSKSPW